MAPGVDPGGVVQSAGLSGLGSRNGDGKRWAQRDSSVHGAYGAGPVDLHPGLCRTAIRHDSYRLLGPGSGRTAGLNPFMGPKHGYTPEARL